MKIVDLVKQDMHITWRSVLRPYFQSYDFKIISDKLDKLYEAQEIIPDKKRLLRPYKAAFDDIKVVIITNKPPIQTNASGRGFETSGKRRKGNIIQLFERLFNSAYPGNLDSWEDQGILLLNYHLIRYNKTEYYTELTEQTIKAINEKLDNVVFIFLGASKKLSKHVNQNRHLVLTPRFNTALKYAPMDGKFFQTAEDYVRKHKNVILTFEW